MSLASVEYLPFLALVVALFQFVPTRLRVHFLLLAGLTAFSQLAPVHGATLAAAILFGWLSGARIDAASEPGRRRVWLLVAVLGLLGLLGFFKYSPLLVSTWNELGLATLSVPEPASPIGISFYTFQSLSYAIDVYRRRAKPVANLFEFALYVSFFPGLVAGPIERVGHLLPQLRATQRLSLSNLSLGARLILWGLVKKWVVADRLWMHVRATLEGAGQSSSSELLVGALAMIALLYCDFSAYTDLARGSARLFGIDLVPNFDRPFVATSPAAMWSRWHMSLCNWLIDYVHLPLSRGKPSLWRIWRNSLLVLGLVGLWHGASWKFLAWGLANGVLIAVQQSWRFLSPAARARGRASLWSLRGSCGWLLTVSAGMVVIIPFFAADFSDCGDYLRRMLGGAGDWSLSRASLGILCGIAFLFVIHAAAASVDLARLWERIGAVGRTLSFVVLVFLLWRLRVDDPAAFIYFQF